MISILLGNSTTCYPVEMNRGQSLSAECIIRVQHNFQDLFQFSGQNGATGSCSKKKKKKLAGTCWCRHETMHHKAIYIDVSLLV